MMVMMMMMMLMMMMMMMTMRYYARSDESKTYRLLYRQTHDFRYVASENISFIYIFWNFTG